MKRSIALLLTVLVPATALAAYVSPSELLLSDAWKKSPLDIAIDAHGSFEDTYYASIWLSGAAQGEPGNLVKANLKMTFDVTGPQLQIRSKWQLRVVDRSAYLFLESVDGQYDGTVAKLVASVTMKKWLRFPLPENMDDTADMKEEMAQVVDAMFELVQKGSTYSLTLKQDALAALADLQSSAMSNLQDLAKTGTIKIDVKVSQSDAIQSAHSVFSFQEQEVKGNGQATITVRSAPVAVSVPENVMDLEDMPSVFGIPGSDFLYDLPADDSSYPSEPIEDTYVDPCTDGTPMQCLSAQRQGLCGQPRPSRRSLDR